MILTIELMQSLHDKYTAAELIEKLDLTAASVCEAFEDEVLAELCEGGALEDEWREYGFDDNDE